MCIGYHEFDKVYSHVAVHVAVQLTNQSKISLYLTLVTLNFLTSLLLYLLREHESITYDCSTVSKKNHVPSAYSCFAAVTLKPHFAYKKINLIEYFA